MNKSDTKLFTSIKPEQPSFNEWCKEFNVGLMYRPGQEIHYELIHEKPLNLLDNLVNLLNGWLR